MSKYNKRTTVKRVSKPNKVNVSGGTAYKMSDRLDLVTLLLTSLVSDKAYTTESEQMKRLEKVVNALIDNGDSEFVAKAVLYARKTIGVRSITHATAAIIAHDVQADWKRRFFTDFPYRVDDMTETVARYMSVYSDSLPNGLKYGFRNAFSRFDNYQLAKYRAEDAEVSLVDLVNLVRPIPTEKNAVALRALINGSLKNTETWESMLSAAGQNAENEEDFKNAKGDVFAELIRNRKIGYFALLRNLRNIAETAPDVLQDALGFITDPIQIKKSLVFPFRFLSALDEIKESEITPRLKTQVEKRLNEALEVSAENVPQFDGSTLVVLDVSGSMGTNIGRTTKMTPARIGGLFSALILSRNPDAELITFDYSARYVKPTKDKGILALAESIPFTGGGTNLESAFELANRHYDRIIVLSDMQSWGHSYLGMAHILKNYERQYGKTKVYSFDLSSNDNSILFPEENVYTLAGFSDKVFAVMNYLERDKQALIHAIESIEF